MRWCHPIPLSSDVVAPKRVEDAPWWIRVPLGGVNVLIIGDWAVDYCLDVIFQESLMGMHKATV